jgi:NADPH-dependent curcumin reductase CurA
MQNVMNRQWVLAGYPEGMPTVENWTLDDQPVLDPGPGQILVKAKWLSVDPYMRGRMSPSANYTKGVAPGEVMQGGGVGEVVASNHPAWKVGEIAESMSFGWQEWSVLTPGPGPAGVNKIDPNLAPIESSLSWLGMPGLTAYFGLVEVGRPRPGETVVVFRRLRRGWPARWPNRETGRLSCGSHSRKRRQASVVSGYRVRCGNKLQEHT